MNTYLVCAATKKKALGICIDFPWKQVWRARASEGELYSAAE
jgi:hypothetical protein